MRDFKDSSSESPIAAAAAADEGWIPVADKRLLAVDNERPDGAPLEFLLLLDDEDDVEVEDAFVLLEGDACPLIPGSPPNPFIRPDWARDENGEDPGRFGRPPKPARPGYKRLGFIPGYRGKGSPPGEADPKRPEADFDVLSPLFSPDDDLEEELLCCLSLDEEEDSFDFLPDVSSPNKFANEAGFGNPGKLKPGNRAGLFRPAIPAKPGKLRKGFSRFWFDEDDELLPEELDAFDDDDEDDPEGPPAPAPAPVIWSMNILRELGGRPKRAGFNPARADGFRPDPGKPKLIDDEEGPDEDEERGDPCVWAWAWAKSDAAVVLLDAAEEELDAEALVSVEVLFLSLVRVRIPVEWGLCSRDVWGDTEA